MDYPQLSVSHARVMAEKLRSFGPQLISIGGGEPLLHKDLVTIIRILAKNNFPVMICNGWFVTREKARALFRAGLYEASVSVDYADPIKHDAQRGKEGAFQRAVDALRLLNENRAHPRQRVHMISVVMDDNLGEVEPLIRLARSIGVTFLVTLYSNGRGKKKDMGVQPHISRHLLRLKKKYKEFVALPGYLEKFSEASEKSGIGPCFAGRNLFNIDSLGNVTLCIDHLDDPVGNILKESAASIKSKLMKQHETNKCKGCWTSCRGSIEPLMYGRKPFRELRSLHEMTKKIPLGEGQRRGD